MCIICVYLQKEKMTPLEARKNLGEMGSSIKEEHKIEVLRLIWKKEDEQDIEEAIEYLYRDNVHGGTD